MALSNGNSFNPNLIYLNMRSQNAQKEKVAPHFEIAKSQPGAPGERSKITPTGETATKVSGNLLRPKFVTREHKGVPNKHVVLMIEDGDETYNLDCTYRISTRSLFNGLLSLTDPNNVSISIYESKKGYEALSLWQNNEMVPWKFDGRAGEIPEPIKVRFKGQDQSDYTPTDDFFEENLKAWADEVFGPDTASSKNEQPQQSAEPEQTQEEVEEKTVTAASLAKANADKAAAAKAKTTAATKTAAPAAKTTTAKTTTVAKRTPAPAPAPVENDPEPEAEVDGPVPF